MTSTNLMLAPAVDNNQLHSICLLHFHPTLAPSPSQQPLPPSPISCISSPHWHPAPHISLQSLPPSLDSCICWASSKAGSHSLLDLREDNMHLETGTHSGHPRIIHLAGRCSLPTLASTPWPQAGACSLQETGQTKEGCFAWPQGRGGGWGWGLLDLAMRHLEIAE